MGVNYVKIYKIIAVLRLIIFWPPKKQKNQYVVSQGFVRVGVMVKGEVRFRV